MYRQSEKNLLNSSISSTRPYNMANCGVLTAEVGSAVWGTQQISTVFFAPWLRFCSDVAHRMPTKLCTMFGRLLGTLYIHFRGLLPPDRMLPVQNSLYVQSLAFSYVGSVTVRHARSWCQRNFAAWYKEWNYGTFEDGASYIWLGGHHVGHRPTF